MEEKTNLNIRVSKAEKKEIENHIKAKTDFENVSSYVRFLIRRDMKKTKTQSIN